MGHNQGSDDGWEDFVLVWTILIYILFAGCALSALLLACSGMALVFMSVQVCLSDDTDEDGRPLSWADRWRRVHPSGLCPTGVGGPPDSAYSSAVVAVMALIPQVATDDLPHKAPCCVCLEGGEQAAAVSPRIPEEQASDDDRLEDVSAYNEPANEPADDPVTHAEQRAADPENSSTASESPTPAPQPDASRAPSPAASSHNPYGTQQSPVAHAGERPWAALACAEFHPVHWDCLRDWLESCSQQGLPFTCPSCRSAIDQPAEAP
eukprot:TRINITY_DN26735_c0_g1_i1.p1 TRINITY_DN26735_c0_g1~~TRINITY_DN26735_c0_g1_i1.p1  ORF type:complete len:265 (+),score=13.19 TRINITY_DN26735_c0_g1_i1:82-876(+)